LGIISPCNEDLVFNSICLHFNLVDNRLKRIDDVIAEMSQYCWKTWTISALTSKHSKSSH
jgi:hypothetical protein